MGCEGKKEYEKEDIVGSIESLRPKKGKKN